MILKNYANFEEKLTWGLKKDSSNLANFHQSTWKSQNWDFDGTVSSKVEKKHGLKIYRGVMCHDNEGGKYSAINYLTGTEIWRYTGLFP